MDAKSISAKNQGQAGTYNLPGDRENQVSPTTTTGDRRWKRTQEPTGSHNNLAGEEPEGLITKSRAGSIVLTTIETNTNGKRWTPDITPDKWEKKGHCQKSDRREHKKRRAVRTRLEGEGSEKVVPEREALEETISDLRSQLDCAAQTIVAKDNDLERLDKEKEKLQQGYNRTNQRMRQIGGMLWKEGV